MLYFPVTTFYHIKHLLAFVKGSSLTLSSRMFPWDWEAHLTFFLFLPVTVAFSFCVHCKHNSLGHHASHYSSDWRTLRTPFYHFFWHSFSEGRTSLWQKARFFEKKNLFDHCQILVDFNGHPDAAGQLTPLESRNLFHGISSPFVAGCFAHTNLQTHMEPQRCTPVLSSCWPLVNALVSTLIVITMWKITIFFVCNFQW